MYYGNIRKTQSLTDWQIIVNGKECRCVKSIAVQISPLIKKYTLTEGNIAASKFVTDIPNLPTGSLDLIGPLITKIFKGKEINFEKNDVEILSLIGEHFEIEDLIKKTEEYRTYQNDIAFYLKNDSEIQEIKKLEKLLLLLEMNDANMEKTIISCLAFSAKIPLNCFIHFISRVCLTNFKNKYLNPNLLLIELMKRLEKYIPGTISLFLKITFEQFFYLNKKGNTETEQREDINSLVSQIFIEKIDDSFTDEITINRNEYKIPLYLKGFFEGDNKSIKIKRIDRPSLKNNAENSGFHKGIAIFLQQDDIESFQKSITNQKIKLNEQKCISYLKNELNEQECSLIEYSAFFGSINCFKFLYNNKVQINREILSNYAIAGGNTEIIHICEQESCIFNENTLNISIKFHHHKLTKWLVETKIVPVNELHLRLCISNYDIYSLIYLITKNINIRNILLYSYECNNIILFKWIFSSKKLTNFPIYTANNINNQTLLHIACERNNVEIVKLLLTKENVEINAIYEVG